MKVTPHVAQNDKRPGGSAINGRTTRHAGYQISQQKRKRIEESFGWLKTIALLRKVRHRGIFKLVGYLPLRPPLTIWCGCGTWARRRFQPHKPGP